LTPSGARVTMSVRTSMVLTIHDESTGAPATTARLLTLRTAKLTARELIRERVIHEVRRHNHYPAEPLVGLIKLSDGELTLNGLLNPARQVARAFESFHKNGFALIVDGIQVESLDQELDLAPDSHIAFRPVVDR
jgi:hypothetical protein